MIRKRSMQNGATNTASGSVRETGRNGFPGAVKPNSTKRKAFERRQLHAKCARRSNAIGHYAFAASLVLSWLARIHEGYVESALSRGNGRSQTGRATASNEHVCLKYHQTNWMRRRGRGFPSSSQQCFGAP